MCCQQHRRRQTKRYSIVKSTNVLEQIYHAEPGDAGVAANLGFRLGPVVMICICMYLAANLQCSYFRSRVL